LSLSTAFGKDTKLEAGFWLLDAGNWMLDSGFWKLDTGHWTLDASCWTLAVGFWLMFFCLLSSLPTVYFFLLPAAASCRCFYVTAAFFVGLIYNL